MSRPVLAALSIIALALPAISRAAGQA